MLLLSSVLLVLQVAGAHLHLCLDGQAPRLQVHVLESPLNGISAQAGVQHVDELVSLSGDRSVRDPSGQFDLPGMLPATILWSLAAVPVLAQRIQLLTDAPPGASPQELLPPLRGPPLTTQA